MEGNFDFLKRVQPHKLTLYPLQLANMDRIINNDAVFIFDEVGCGKTISSGLMALSYLENCNTNKKILVITINSLIKTDQFKNDWVSRVPFTKEQIDRIVFCNNHYRSIERQKGENWGLIIVDEAQLFLSDQDKAQTDALKALTAEKVVFLTATPIRRDEDDLDSYVCIAQEILKKDDEWKNNISEKLRNITKGSKNVKDNICAKFDPNLPVTRYFKDTVRCLKGSKDQEIIKEDSKRRLAKIWRVGNEAATNSESKEECLFLNMENVLEKGDEHHFVVFSTKKQAEELGKYAETRGFEDYTKNRQAQKTYRVVTGDNSEELSSYSGISNESNPTVLFVNYQIAEQGVNLPGFDYVVNYQISQFPSRLEQRFGRIDRLGKNGKGKYRDIKVCYVLDKWFDSSTLNFYHAMNAYINSILPYLPSRNMILDETILKELKSAKDSLEAEKSKWQSIKEKLENRDELFPEEREAIENCKNEVKLDEEWDDSTDLEDLLVVADRLQKCEQILSGVKSGVDKAEKMGLIQYLYEVQDQIFVRDTDQVGVSDGHTPINAFFCDECAKIIREEPCFKDYENLIGSFEFINKCADLYAEGVPPAINYYLIMAFVLGDMNALYPLDGAQRQMKRILSIDADKIKAMGDEIGNCRNIKVMEDYDNRKILFDFAVGILRYSQEVWGEDVDIGDWDWESVLNLSDEDKAFLIKNAESFFEQLPVYKHLEEAAEQLYCNGNELDTCSSRSYKTDLWKQFLYAPNGEYNKLKFLFYTKGEKGWEPSPYFKLFYHYERAESPKMKETVKSLRYPDPEEALDYYSLCARREQECIKLVEAFRNYREENGSENKRIFEQRLNAVQKSNREVEKKHKQFGWGEDKKSWSSYARIFYERDVSNNWVRKEKWKLKKYESKPYADNENRIIWGMFVEIIDSEGLRKRMDYWSYNLLKEMLEVDQYWDRNTELMFIFTDSYPAYGFDWESIGIRPEDYGFDWESIGIRPEELEEDMDSLTRDFLSAISPWLLGKENEIQSVNS